MRAWVAKRGIPYFLLLPGLVWLVIFFVVPMYLHGQRLPVRGLARHGYEFTWQWAQLHRRARAVRRRSSSARSCTRASRRLLCLLIAYPLAYAIAFKAGRWKNVLLLAVVAPFFTTYLIRTYAWQTILSDDGVVVDFFQTIGILGSRRAPAGDAGRRDRRPHLQLPAVHDPADLRQPRADGPATDRGREGPLLVLAHRVPQGDAADLGPGSRRRRRCSPSSPPSATTSTPRSSAAPSRR